MPQNFYSWFAFALNATHRERHALGASIKHDQCDRCLARHASMERISHLGRYLPSGEALFLAVFFPFKGELSGQDIGGIGHRMSMPFERRVRWNRNLENRTLRPAGWVGGIRLT